MTEVLWKKIFNNEAWEGRLGAPYVHIVHRTFQYLNDEITQHGLKREREIR